MMPAPCCSDLIRILITFYIRHIFQSPSYRHRVLTCCRCANFLILLPSLRCLHLRVRARLSSHRIDILCHHWKKFRICGWWYFTIFGGCPEAKNAAEDRFWETRLRQERIFRLSFPADVVVGGRASLWEHLNTRQTANSYFTARVK